ncbi:PQQ-binding-like beta-propeller repeat protein [Streptomyces sp. NRRL S-118]|uniref:outer membrane protein assembly factor BamB family protein n=1 Tax=Streptomyces sp. NRRL S-118 TaxID=1463881 RepID=UPI0004C956C2|nr:PQQ-binding-like beta-propeller repeat protein [Streptomyces sp. NRRL S-118]
MSQPPPPPPNQPPTPPQGGFGAPQDPPPQGGFGAPTPPPPGGFGGPTPPPGQPPAYGYPQAPQPPQTPPPGQPEGYGYPQAPQPPQTPPPGQPQGYGFPQAPGQPGPYPGQVPGQQPYGYGYPGAPVQQPATPQGGGRKLSTQMQIIIAAAVAVVLIIAGGVWFAMGDDGGKGADAKGTTGTTGGGKGGGGGGGTAADGPGKEKAPANTASKVAFQKPHPKVTYLTNVVGSWVTDKAYVKTGINSIVAYDLDKGTELWTIPLPGQVCAASRHTEGNRTAIAFEPAKATPPKNFQPCSEVGAIDLSTGKLLWSKSVTGGQGGDDKARFTEVTVGAGTVAAGGTDGGAAWDLATGKERWKPQVNAEQCYDMGYGGGAGLVAARKCGPYDQQYVIIQNLDPATGAPLSQFKMPTGVEYASVVSTKPLVVAADVGDSAGDGSGISDFFSIDEKTGKLKAKIAVDADRFAAECDVTEVESCIKVAVGNGRIYLPTEDHEGSGEYGQTNEIVSFELATGKPTSDKSDAGDRYSMFPLRMDGGNILAYKEPPYDKGGQIVSIDGATMKQTVLMENPGEESVRRAESSFSVGHSEMLFSGGRLFISETMISEPSDSGVDDDQFYMIGYTTN